MIFIIFFIIKKKLCSKMNSQFQTCSHDYGTQFYTTFLDAFEAYKNDKSIWKISWDDCHRWRPKAKKDIWENEETLVNLSEEYADEENVSRVFWVWQLTIPENCDELFAMEKNGEITKEEMNKQWDRACIKSVITQEEFVNRFRFL